LQIIYSATAAFRLSVLTGLLYANESVLKERIRMKRRIRFAEIAEIHRKYALIIARSKILVARPTFS
jgi:hypothetical protein